MGWVGLHHAFTQYINLKNMILLDSDSSDIVFSNPKYVSNMKQANKILELGANGKLLILTKICDT